MRNHALMQAIVSETAEQKIYILVTGFSYLTVRLLFFSFLLLYFIARIRRRRKKFTFAISSADEFLVQL